MAIKRPTKSRGGPARKSAVTAPVRHVEVMAAQRMIPGEAYTGWLCKSRQCGLVIAIAPPPAGAKTAASDFDDQLGAIKCPHCGDEDLYRWSARAQHIYAARGVVP